MNKDEVRLTRTAAKIYLYLVKKGEALGVREVAKALRISPSTVHYHLKRLEDMGLVQKEGDRYRVRKIVNPDELVVLGRYLIPRLSIYSFFFLGISIGLSIAVIIKGFNIDRALAIAISLTAFTVLFIEGMRVAKRY